MNSLICIAEQIVSVITQVCKGSKLRIDPNLRRPSFSFTYSFKFTYFFFWENKKPFKTIKITRKHKNLRRLRIQLEIPSCLGYGPKSFDARIKINVLYQLALLSNNLVKILYMNGIYLELLFLGYGERCRKHWKERRMLTKEKHWKIKREKTKNTEKVK